METRILDINIVNKNDVIPYDLLLLSDDTKEAIDKNLDKDLKHRKLNKEHGQDHDIKKKKTISMIRN